MPLPISKAQAIKAAHWLKTNFTPQMTTAIAGTPVTIDLLCAISCQETATAWLDFIDNHPPAEVIQRCVYDASGDFPGTSRGAFPKNTAAFRAVYGDAFTDMLIEEANKSRAMRKYSPRPWVYKGYGLFQYDLQNIKTDKAFFEQKKWYDVDACCANAVRMLTANHARYQDWWKAIKAYNGSGPRAEAYANNVMIFWDYCKTT